MQLKKHKIEIEIYLPEDCSSRMEEKLKNTKFIGSNPIFTISGSFEEEIIEMTIRGVVKNNKLRKAAYDNICNHRGKVKFSIDLKKLRDDEK